MARGNNQKLKILYIMKILLENTDENHKMTMPQIIKSLERYDISAERKSIYNDLECLRLYGLDIIGEKYDKSYCYYIGSREFETAELKLLVDSVQSSRFITAKKSNELIKKIEGFTSKYEAVKLHRQVYVMQRRKTENEAIYYNVDKIHSAIGNNCMINFQYFQWNVDKEMEIKKNGALYCVSPWALSWDNENYYLIGFDENDNMIKHYRVDKMLHIEIKNEERQGRKLFDKFDMVTYTNKMFGMYKGEEETVKIECTNDLAGVIIDRFGKEVSLIKKDDKHFYVNVKASVSKQFIGWVIALGDGAKIVGPESVLVKINDEIERLIRQYK